MLRRPPSSTLSLHDALPIYAVRARALGLPVGRPDARARDHRVGIDRVDADPVRASLLGQTAARSEEHTSELQSRQYLVCRLLLEKKKTKQIHCPRSNEVTH